MNRIIKDIVADILGLEPEAVGDDLSRDTADNWDSLNHLRIITAVEQMCAVSLTMDEIQSAVSVASLAQIVAGKAATT